MATDTLACPTCPDRMRAVPQRPAPTFACPTCRAIWIGASALRQLGPSELPALQLRKDTTERACARCQSRMLAANLGAIEVEYCASCDAILFDVGELESLLPEPKRKAAGAPPPGPTVAPGTQFLCASCHTMHPRLQARQSHKGPLCPQCAPRVLEAERLARSQCLQAPPPSESTSFTGTDVLTLLLGLVATFVDD